MAAPLRLAGPTGTWVLAPGTWLIGRGEQCRVMVDDPRLSRAHARVTVAEDAAPQLEDLGSINGVLVNGDRIKGLYRLCDGDVVVCGPLVLVASLADDPGPIAESEPIRPPTYQRRPTEEMPPEALAAMATPILRPRRPGSASRPIDPGIIAAVTGSSVAKAVQRDDPRRKTDSLMPSEAPSAHGEDSSALEPGIGHLDEPQAPPLRRVLAGALDGLTAVLAILLLALPVALLGWMGGVTKAGVAIGADRLPQLVPGAHTELADLAAALLRPGALSRVLQLADALRQLDDRGPFLLVFLGCTGAVLLLVLVVLLGLVGATVINGGPTWHRRLHLKILVARNGHHPGWGRAGWRWLLATLLWPIGLVAACCGRRSPHDLLSGCEVRHRP
ncbi:MAG: FHA domain-containing protein [Planctomycetes bacterium]|nr:FHA domain-containing protein [Planctomycetota bacterium]